MAVAPGGPPRFNIELTTGTWTGDAGALREQAGVVYLLHEPEVLSDHPPLEGIRNAGLLPDEEAMLTSAGYRVYSLPNRGEYWIPAEQHPAARTHAGAAVAARAGHEELQRLSRQPTPIASYVPPTADAHLQQVARRVWEKLPKFEVRGRHFVQHQALKDTPGQVDLLTMAGYQHYDAETIANAFNNGKPLTLVAGSELLWAPPDLLVK